MTSIRFRLLLLFLGLTLIVWAATVGSTYWQTYHEVEEVYDAHLVQSAEELLVLATHEYAEQVATVRNSAEAEAFPFEIQALARHHTGEEYAPRLSFRVLVADRILLHSADAPLDTPPGSDGFGERRDANGLWRVYTLRSARDGFTVEVAEHYGIRSKIVDEVAQASIVPAVFAFPVIAMLAWFAVYRLDASALSGPYLVQSNARLGRNPPFGLDRTKQEPTPRSRSAPFPCDYGRRSPLRVARSTLQDSRSCAAPGTASPCRR